MIINRKGTYYKDNIEITNKDLLLVIEEANNLTTMKMRGVIDKELYNIQNAGLDGLKQLL